GLQSPDDSADGWHDTARSLDPVVGVRADRLQLPADLGQRAELPDSSRSVGPRRGSLRGSPTSSFPPLLMSSLDDRESPHGGSYCVRMSALTARAIDCGPNRVPATYVDGPEPAHADGVNVPDFGVYGSLKGGP